MTTSLPLDVLPGGFTADELAIIRAACRQVPAVRRAILFGSRAKGTHRRASDVDLALDGPRLTLHDTGTLAGLLEESILPYFFDLVLLPTLENAALRAHIQRVGVVVYVVPA